MDDEPGGGGLPLFPLVLVVIFAGLLLGGVLAHFFGGTNQRPKSASTAVAAVPPIVPTPAPTPPVLATTTPSPTFAPSPTSAPSATPSPTPPVLSTPRVVPTPKRLAKALTQTMPPAPSATPPLASTAKAAPVAHVATSPKAFPVATVAAAPKPVAEVSSDDRATTIVRSYLGALARGDRTAASAYLAHGAPSEVFMGSGARIESIRSASVGAEQYKVTADVQTESGEYYVTFTLEPGPGGLQITDHYAIKPQ